MAPQGCYLLVFMTMCVGFVDKFSTSLLVRVETIHSKGLHSIAKNILWKDKNKRESSFVERFQDQHKSH